MRWPPLGYRATHPPHIAMPRAFPESANVGKHAAPHPRETLSHAHEFLKKRSACMQIFDTPYDAGQPGGACGGICVIGPVHNFASVNRFWGWCRGDGLRVDVRVMVC